MDNKPIVDWPMVEQMIDNLIEIDKECQELYKQADMEEDDALTLLDDLLFQTQSKEFIINNAKEAYVNYHILLLQAIEEEYYEMATKISKAIEIDEKETYRFFKKYLPEHLTDIALYFRLIKQQFNKQIKSS